LEGTRTRVIQLVIALVLFVVAVLLIRAELADQRTAQDPSPARTSEIAERLQRRIAQLRRALVGPRVTSPPAIPRDETHWPPTPAPVQAGKAEIHLPPDIGAWSAVWLAPSHSSDPPVEGDAPQSLPSDAPDRVGRG